MTHTFSPVWLSTDRQLAALAQAYASATPMARLSGRLPVPEGVTHMRGVLLPWMRMALVLSAQGELGFYRGSLVFKQKPFKAFGWRVLGQHEKLSFSLEAQDVVAIEPADFSSPVMRLFDLPFTRIRTTREGVQKDFLLCVGGRIAMPLIKARSMALREALMDWHGGHGCMADDEVLAS